jgi:serine/threonine protein kinase
VKSLEGTILNGYKLIRLIGEGGFGQVWLAQNTTTCLYKALKVIQKKEIEAWEKELQGVIAYSQKSHFLLSPHLIPIEYVGSDNELLFYVMPLSDPEIDCSPLSDDWRPSSLDHIIKKQKTRDEWFSYQEIESIILSLLKGLKLLHDNNLIHRDIKPSNILFMNGNACLADFGIMSVAKTNLTKIGTPEFFPPSYYLDMGGNPDMYSFASTFYSFLTGFPPDCIGRPDRNYPKKNKDLLDAETERRWESYFEIIYKITSDDSSEWFENVDSIIEYIESIEKCCDPKSKQNYENDEQQEEDFKEVSNNSTINKASINDYLEYSKQLNVDDLRCLMDEEKTLHEFYLNADYDNYCDCLEELIVKYQEQPALYKFLKDLMTRFLLESDNNDKLINITADEENPSSDKLQAYLLMKQYDEALKVVDDIISKDNANYNYYLIRSFILKHLDLSSDSSHNDIEMSHQYAVQFDQGCIIDELLANES